MCGGEITTEATAAAPHVVLLSSPGMGHVAPVAELARRLHDALGFTATVLTYASSDSAAQRAFLSSLPPAISAATLPPVHLGDGDLPAGAAAIETLLSVEAERSVPAITAFLSDLKSTTNLVAFVADLFGAATLRAARDAGGVPGFLFFPSNLLMLSLMLHLPRLDADLGAGEFRDLPEPVRLPGCVPVPGADILQPLQDRASDAYRWMVRHGERYRDAPAGILVNTFDAAEPAAAAALRSPEPWRPPVYPIGPVIQHHHPAGDAGEDATGCIGWLDAQPEGSVLFVSFGSGGALSLAQTRELARGLELAGHRFLWVVRAPTDAAAAAAGGDNPGESYYDGCRSKAGDPVGFLPAGFMERTKGLGHVVPSWAPQTRGAGPPRRGGDADALRVELGAGGRGGGGADGGVAAVRRAEAERRHALRGNHGGAAPEGGRRRRRRRVGPCGGCGGGGEGGDGGGERGGGARQGEGAQGGGEERARAWRRVVRDAREGRERVEGSGAGY